MQYEDLDGQVNILRRLVKSSFMRSLAVHLSHGKCVIKPNIHTPHSYLKLDVKITRPIDRIFNQDFPRATKLTGNKSCLFVYTAAIFGKTLLDVPFICHPFSSPISCVPVCCHDYRCQGEGRRSKKRKLNHVSSGGNI